MATRLIVLFTAGVVAASVAYSLFAGGSAARDDEPDTERANAVVPEPRALGPRARELRAAPGIWSAWTPYPPFAREATTVLWRTEGTTERPSVAGRRGGRDLDVRFGPVAVLPTLAGAGLDWRRPGREWGSRLVFPHAGIWTVRVRVGDRTGSVRVRVVESRPAAG